MFAAVTHSRLPALFRVLFSMALFAGIALFGFAPPASAAVPDPDDVFTFDNSLTSTTGSGTVLAPYPTCAGTPTDPCNTSTGFGTTGGDSYWEWSSSSTRFGGGFVYNPNANVGTSYTFFLKFQITTPSSGGSYNKLVDYNNLADDDGFYLEEDGGDWFFTFYPLDTGSTPYSVTQLLDLAVVRDSSVTPATFTVYTRTSSGGFTEEYQVADPSGLAIPALISGDTLLGFFGEDGNSNEAIRAGRVFDLRFWYDTALTEAQLNEQFAGIYTVTYDANGATSGSVPTATSAAGAQTVAQNSGTLEKSGFSFAGWNTQADGRGVTYAPGSTITPSSSVTLFAKWDSTLANTGSPSDSLGWAAAAGLAGIAGLALLVLRSRVRHGHPGKTP